MRVRVKVRVRVGVSKVRGWAGFYPYGPDPNLQRAVHAYHVARSDLHLVRIRVRA